MQSWHPQPFHGVEYNTVAPELGSSRKPRLERRPELL